MTIYIDKILSRNTLNKNSTLLVTSNTRGSLKCGANFPRHNHRLVLKYFLPKKADIYRLPLLINGLFEVFTTFVRKCTVLTNILVVFLHYRRASKSVGKIVFSTISHEVKQFNWLFQNT